MHLHCDTDEGKEVEFQQTDHDLVKLVHRCGERHVKSYLAYETSKVAYSWPQGLRRRCERWPSCATSVTDRYSEAKTCKYIPELIVELAYKPDQDQP